MLNTKSNANGPSTSKRTATAQFTSKRKLRNANVTSPSIDKQCTQTSRPGFGLGLGREEVTAMCAYFAVSALRVKINAGNAYAKRLRLDVTQIQHAGTGDR